MPLPDHGREIGVSTRHISNPSYGPPTFYWVAIDDDRKAEACLRAYLKAPENEDRLFEVSPVKPPRHAMELIGMTSEKEVRLQIRMADEPG